MKLVDSTPFLLVQPLVSQIPCFVLQLPLQVDIKSLLLHRVLQRLAEVVKVLAVPLLLGKCRVKLVQQVVIHTLTLVCPILDILNMDNLLVTLRGCHNRHMVGQGSPCHPFLQEELVEVIQTHHSQEAEELLVLPAVHLRPLVEEDQERLQEHQLQVKCQVVCPDILGILTPLCTLTCIGNRHSTWAHRMGNSNNNHFIHQDMLPEVLVREDLEDLLVVLTPINSRVAILEGQVQRHPRETRMIRMLDQKVRRSLQLKRARKRLQKEKRRLRRNRKSQKRLRVHRNHFHSRELLNSTKPPLIHFS
mmetsp:Transcript_30746/g.48183  ORF Transcript_30746/g.48183 Transcript_30746/m.48183 type:complete len:305 (-) Transcript_30746:670-1584(-)